jgi:hypothetical protein
VSAVDVAEYVYVDTAYGGVDRRNIVRRLTEIRLNGLSDCYASHGRATEDLASWLAEHTNKDGKPTVAGYNGLTWAPNLHLDFDAEGNLPLALTYLLRVLDRLESWGVDLSSVRIYFSAAKGFHLEIPHTLFGAFAPAASVGASDVGSETQGGRPAQEPIDGSKIALDVREPRLVLAPDAGSLSVQVSPERLQLSDDHRRDHHCLPSLRWPRMVP